MADDNPTATNDSVPTTTTNAASDVTQTATVPVTPAAPTATEFGDDFVMPEIPQAPQPNEGAARGVEYLRQLADGQKAIAARMEKLERARQVDPLLDQLDPATANPPLTEALRPFEQKISTIETMLGEQRQHARIQEGRSVFVQQAGIVKGLVDQFASAPEAKLFVGKPDAKPLVVEQATARINQMIANGIQRALQEGRDPSLHGVTDDHARAIFAQEYNNARRWAQMFAGPQQVVQQQQINQSQGVPTGNSSSPNPGTTNEEPDPALQPRQWREWRQKQRAATESQSSRV